MVTELTENLKLLLFSNDMDQQDLGLRAMGYNETKEDFVRLKELIKPFGWLIRSTKDYYADYLVKRMNKPPKNPYAFEEIYLLPPKYADHVTRYTE